MPVLQVHAQLSLMDMQTLGRNASNDEMTAFLRGAYEAGWCDGATLQVQSPYNSTTYTVVFGERGPDGDAPSLRPQGHVLPSEPRILAEAARLNDELDRIASDLRPRRNARASRIPGQLRRSYSVNGISHSRFTWDELMEMPSLCNVDGAVLRIDTTDLQYWTLLDDVFEQTVRVNYWDYDSGCWDELVNYDGSDPHIDDTEIR